MKNVIRSRVELLWAKIAGRDVNITTMIPSVETNMTEKLMIETAKRIGDIEKAIDDMPEPEPAGSQIFRIKVTDGQEASTYESDVTFAEIYEALEDGSALICDADITTTYGPFRSTLATYARNYDAVDGNISNITFTFTSFTTVQDTLVPFSLCISLSNGGVSVDSLILAAGQ